MVNLDTSTVESISKSAHMKLYGGYDLKYKGIVGGVNFSWSL
jgi:hypothetical protein